MTYLQPRKTPSRLTGTVGTLLILIIIFGGMQFFWPHVISGLVNSFAHPFWKTEFSLESGALDSPSKLLSQNEELKRQLSLAEVRIANISEIEYENSEIKIALGRATTTNRILGAVLKRPPFTLYDELVIDIGQDYSLATGTAVYTPENIRIGTITNVSDGTSIVRLLSSPGEKYDVLAGPHKEPVTAIGRGGGQYAARIPHEAEISEGDTVVNSEINGSTFGTITAKIFDPAEPFGWILFSPNINIYKLRWVLVDNKAKI